MTFPDWCLNNISNNYVEIQAICKDVQMVFCDHYREVSSSSRKHSPSAPVRAVHARQGREWIGRASYHQVWHNDGLFSGYK